MICFRTHTWLHALEGRDVRWPRVTAVQSEGAVTEGVMGGS